MGRDILKRLADPELLALGVGGRQWPRRVLSETPIPDAWMGLVETADGLRRFVPAGDAPRLQRDDRLLLVRNRHVCVPIRIGETPAACGNAVAAECELLIAWNASENDLAALRRTLVTGGELSLSELARRVASAGGAEALRGLVRETSASDLVHGDAREALFRRLRERLERFCFESGAQLDRVAKLTCTSASLERSEAMRSQARDRVQRIEAREMVERAARAAAIRRLDDVGSLLAKLRAAAAADPALQWRDLLPALAPAERGRLLENLWRVTPDQRRAAVIVAAAGGELVWLDPSRPDKPLRTKTLPIELGGLRSVTFAADAGPASGAATRDLLLVGAARGVWALRAEDGEVVGRYEVPFAGTPRTGFNSATIARGRIFATHSALGFWCWSVDGQPQPEPMTQTRDGLPKTIRAATALANGDVLYAIDHRVQRVDVESGEIRVVAVADSSIHDLACYDATVLIATDGGKLLRVDLNNPQDVWAPYRRSGALESVHVRRWSDLVEVVVPAGPDGILAVYEQENVISRLVETSTPVRKAWACDDLVVGLSDTRDRLVVLSADAPDRRGADVPLARLLGGTVQDVCIVTKDCSAA